MKFMLYAIDNFHPMQTQALTYPFWYQYSNEEEKKIR